MSLIALGSMKSSPGVTTAALALASVWPSSQRVIVAEFDPAGGDIATRFGRAFEPGVISLAAAVRRSSGSAAAIDHCQQVLGGVDVLMAPANPAQLTAAVRLLDERREWTELRGGEPQILADCGRLFDEPTVAHLLQASSLVVVLARPILSELHHVSARLSTLQALAGRVTLVLSGHGPYSADEVADTLHVDVLGSLPSDPESAAILAGAPGSRRTLARLPLLRAASELVEKLQMTVPLEAKPTTSWNDMELDAVLAGGATT
jgi:MinD-like ATPase involved in chromosome partitioning or flagellar assembly